LAKLKAKAFLFLAAFLIFEAVIGAWCINSIKEQNNNYYLQLVKEEARKLDERFQIIKAYWTLSSEVPEIKEAIAFCDNARPAVKKRAGEHMRSMVKLANAEFAFLMDLKGTCTFSTKSLFLEHNYGFRPYFKDALAKGSGFFMAYGITSKTLGFYFASRVTYHDKPVGVAVLKLSDKAMWPELFGNRKPATDILSGPFSGLITEFGAVAAHGGKFYVLDEISSTLRKYLKKNKQFPINRVQSLGFPAGTWSILKVRGLWKARNPKNGEIYYLYAIPMKAEGLLLFYSIPEEVMATVFKGVIHPIYSVLLVLFISFLAMTVLLFFKEEREKRLSETHKRLQKEHKKYVELSSRYKSIIDTAQEGFWVIHPKDRTILEVNDAICRILGYSREEILGRTPFDLVDGENLKILKKQASLPDRSVATSM